jgi:hypothetical protein
MAWLIFLAAAFLSGALCAAAIWISKRYIPRFPAWLLVTAVLILAIVLAIISFLICFYVAVNNNIEVDPPDANADAGPTVFFAILVVSSLAGLASLLGSIIGAISMPVLMRLKRK